MKLIDTRYEATLKNAGGTTFVAPIKNYSTHNWPQRLWAVYYSYNNYCLPCKFEDTVPDSELYNAGYYKVVSVNVINLYEKIVSKYIYE